MALILWAGVGVGQDRGQPGWIRSDDLEMQTWELQRQLDYVKMLKEYCGYPHADPNMCSKATTGPRAENETPAEGRQGPPLLPMILEIAGIGDRLRATLVYDDGRQAPVSVGSGLPGNHTVCAIEPRRVVVAAGDCARGAKQALVFARTEDRGSGSAGYPPMSGR